MMKRSFSKLVGTGGRYVLLVIAVATKMSFVAIADPILASRQVDWSQSGIVGGIPSVTTVYTTIAAGASAATINSAIASCPSNQVVKLGPGVFNLSGGLVMEKDGVVLRGSGPNQTFLSIGGGGYSRIRVDAPYNDVNSTDPPNVVNWTAGYGKGTTVITLSSTAGLAVGRMIMLDQLNTAEVDGAGQEGCTYCGRGSSGGSGPRAQFQGVTVTSISGNQVTISPGIYMPNISGSQSPQAWWFNNNPRQRCGIEELTITNTAYGNNISFEMCNNCWVTNVNSYNCYNDHLRTYFATHCQVEHSYFYGWANAGDNYGVNFYYGWDNRCVNNVFEHIGQAMVIETAGQGNSFLYNYVHDLYYPADSTWLAEGTMTHAAGVCMNLFEGNWMPHLYMDRIHGNGMYNTVVRNVITGLEPGKNSSTMVIAVQARSIYQNFVGNVLGSGGYHNQYQCVNGNASGMNTCIWYLGFDNSNGSSTGYDANVVQTILRDGNYDVVTSTNGGVVLDPSVTDHSIPASYALSGTPSWFGNRQWPAFNSANGAAIAANSGSMTNIPAGYRSVFGVDPPVGNVNQPPVAVATGSPKTGKAPLSVTFSSVGSLDPEGVALSYTWTFGDGSTSTLANPSHTYTAAGSFAAQLRVSDGVNSTVSSNIVIQVTSAGVNLPPVAVVTASPTNGVVPLAVSFSSSGSSDPEGTPLTYNWDFGDGTTSTVANPTHTYAAAGVYSAQLQVSDGTNVTSSSVLSINAFDPGSGLVAAYGFEEGTGSTVSDLSGNGNPGAITGATWTTQGKYGNALSFDGTNSLVVVNSSSSLNMSSAMTQEAWVYPTLNQTTWSAVLHKQTDAYYLHVSSPAGSMIPAGGAIYNSTESYVAGTSPVPLNVWTHLAVTYDGTMMRFYVNGSQVDTKAASGTIQTNSNPLRIGGNTYGQYFAGLIDEVRIYNRALSQGEIASDMNTPVASNVSRPPAPTGLRVVSQ
jgi:PKD repeat protein